MSVRQATLEYLLGQYRESLRLSAQLKHAIDALTGELPPDSPYRYVSQGVGNAIVMYLDKVKEPRSIKQITKELEDGGCVFGVVKSPTEIVKKAVVAFVRHERLTWIDQQRGLVGSPNWSKQEQE
ncbi:MAG TPA: hypothetical protein VKZ53_22270 [Candidatus Angelobacter sp.]|nr:hypothetical protein [Candidatus Angelobacter sp.]